MDESPDEVLASVLGGKTTLKIRVLENRIDAGSEAARHAAAILRTTIQERGSARIIGASAASQIEFLDALVQEPGIDWSKVELFHLDEYIGLPSTHPASFCKFLQDRLINRTGIKRYHFLNGEEDTTDSIRRVSKEIQAAPIDVAFIGIGENGHLAFNDPPANFDTEEPFIVVTLDELCRKQQVAEGWFKDIEDVPKRAISMSIRQILKAREILAIVPGKRKAHAVRDCFTGPVRPTAPASILRDHEQTTVYLDRESAALLTGEQVAAFA